MKETPTNCQRTGAGARVSTFSGEGSTAVVTSVGVSSGLGAAAVVVAGSDIMLWDEGWTAGLKR